MEYLFNKVFLKKETPTLVFSCEYSEIFKNSFFHRTNSVAASVLNLISLHTPQVYLHISSERFVLLLPFFSVIQIYPSEQLLFKVAIMVLEQQSTILL